MAYRVFDQHAERYDFWYKRNPVLVECEAKVIRSLNLKGKGLSIGVGTGILDAEAPIEVGVEPALNMLLIASSRGITPIRAVGEYLPLRKECFEFALMTATICFLDSPEEVIMEAKRVLRVGGKLVVCIVSRDSSWGEEYLKKGEAGHVFYRHARFFSCSEVEDMLVRLGFKVATIKATLSYPPSEEPRIEEPSDRPEGKGFLCIKAVKT